MSDKLKLLQVDQLRMDEVPILEKMSGYSVMELFNVGDQVPMAVISALAYLTERRGRPSLKKSAYGQLTTAEFMQHLQDRFEFDTSTPAADYAEWTVADLRAELAGRGLPVGGRKPLLIDRLQTDDGASPDPTQAG